MKKMLLTAASAAIMLMQTSCSSIFPDTSKPSAEAVYDEVWQLVDRQYVNFANTDINWDDAYARHIRKIGTQSTDDKLFNCLRNLLNELQDGHVSLYTGDKEWTADISMFLSQIKPFVVENNYLGNKSGKSGGLIYKALKDGKVGYVRYESFKDTVTEEQVDKMFHDFRDCEGIVFDIRSNRGGYVSNELSLLSRLPEVDRGLILVRKEDGSRDLKKSGWTNKPQRPADNLIWRKPFIVLIDGVSFSAASTFAMSAKECGNVRLVGTMTGGGTSIPTYHELSNGWILKLPTQKVLPPDGTDYEKGVPPDVEITLDINSRSADNIIEAACDLISGPSR